MSNERSAEWLRGAVESHINTCNLITSITSAAKSHPARQGLMAASNELHNQLDRYRTLLAAAEAREATQPTAAEVVIEVLNSALLEMYEGACGRIGNSKTAAKHSRQLKALFVYQQYRDQLARWKEANGGK